MKRPLLLTLLLVTVDQASKTLAALWLNGVRIEWAPDWGLTYVLNPGLWVYHDLNPSWFPVLQVLVLPALLLVAGSLPYYHRFYRRSAWIDLAAGLFWAAALGNLYLDRWWAGGARDFLLTPWFVANLADCYGSAALAALGMEFVTFAPARRLLRLTPLRESAQDLRSLMNWLKQGPHLWY